MPSSPGGCDLGITVCGPVTGTTMRFFSETGIDQSCRLPLAQVTLEHSPECWHLQSPSTLPSARHCHTCNPDLLWPIHDVCGTFGDKMWFDNIPRVQALKGSILSDR